jgi:excisionase family DNA binding protein
MNHCKECNAPLSEGDLFCSKCGAKKVEPILEPLKLPKMLTVKEAASMFFSGKVSAGLIYSAAKEHRLPHVKMSGGKILLDVDELNKWWDEELKKSKLTVVKGLRRID